MNRIFICVIGRYSCIIELTQHGIEQYGKKSPKVRVENEESDWLGKHGR